MQITRLLVGPLETNCYIVSEDGSCCWIIDPGDEAETIIRTIEELHMTPLGILLTHGHLDHILAVPDLISRRFTASSRSSGSETEALRTFIHPEDRNALGENAGVYHKAFFMAIDPAMYYQHVEQISRLPEPDLFLEDEAVLPGSTLRVMHIPGHSPGSAALYSEQHHVLFSGDALFRGSIGRCDLPGGNMNLLVNRLKESVLALPDDTRVCPGHGAETTIAFERKNNPFLLA